MELKTAIQEFQYCEFLVSSAAIELERRNDQRWNRHRWFIDEIGLYAHSILFDNNISIGLQNILRDDIGDFFN